MSEFKGFKNSKVYVEGQGIIKTSIKNFIVPNIPEGVSLSVEIYM